MFTPLIATQIPLYMLRCLQRSDVYEPLLKRVVYHYLTRSPTATVMQYYVIFEKVIEGQMGALHSRADGVPSV